MRSFLFVPADSPRKIAKALTSETDVVILDLEDSVAPHAKPAARQMAAEALDQHRTSENTPQIYVRINALDTGMAKDDLAAVLARRPDALMQPKTNSGDDVATLAAMCGKNPPPVIAIATETPASLFNLGTYDRAGPALCAMTWGAEDLSSTLGALSSRDDDGALTPPYQLARSLCLAGARAAGVEPVDTIFADFRDAAGLEAECAAAMRDGFTGKLAIHPAQVPVINQIFTPSPEAIAHARALADAFADADNAGVIAMNGRMYDIPHLTRAKNLLKRAERFNAG